MLKINVISNFLGAGYSSILQFVLVPFLLKYLGAEAYGLVGIYITLLAALNMLDLGLSPALSRELARLSALPNSVHLMRSTVTTLECIYFVIALLIISIFWFAAPLIAKYWLNNNALPTGAVSACLQVMGIQCAFQFVSNYYNNGLIGLQRMALANSMLALNNTLRAGAGLFVLIAASASVEVYFLSQALVTFIGLLITAYALHRVLPANSSANESKYKYFQKIKLRFNLERFNACKRFAAGMAITSVCVFFIMQTDKLILSKLVTLEQFGYYTVAINIALTIAGAAGIISRSVLPRMTQLVAINDSEAIKALYLKASALVAWIILPVAGLLIMFNQQFLTFYLGDVEKVVYISPIFVLLMLGYAVHSLMHIPYALSLAYGWTRYGINISIVAIVVMTPITIFATLRYGVIGAATAWVVLSIGYLGFSLRYLHQKIHKGLMLKFYKTISLQVLILVLCFVSIFVIY